jgi:hypothetical protein|tara:strand:+ start:1572 stop:1916 length:345 start_codon:yes stop_codon:yes gene_type:complete
MVVDCEWLDQERILINPDGQVLPCCYIANFYFEASQRLDQGKADKFFSKHFADKMRHDVVQSYHNDRDKHNLFNNDMADIVNSEWYTKTLPESFKSEDTVHPICQQQCGRKKCE